MKFIPGLTSVTFRDKSIKQIVEITKQNGLSLIEWGGDIHVPNANLAQEAYEETKKSDITISSYGSYYLLGKNQNFDGVLSAAKVLNAPIIRVWAGDKSPNIISQQEYNQVVADAKIICEKASKVGIKVGLECHHDTLTENRKSAVDFMNAVNHPNLYFYWQPNEFLPFSENLLFAKDLAYKTIALHAFYWEKENKYPLAKGLEIWIEYLKIFKNCAYDLPILLEFMHDGKVESLPETAKALIEIIQSV